MQEPQEVKVEIDGRGIAAKVKDLNAALLTFTAEGRKEARGSAEDITGGEK